MFNDKERLIIENLSDRFSSIHENQKSKEGKTTSSPLGDGIKFPTIYEYPQGFGAHDAVATVDELEQSISDVDAEKTNKLEYIVQKYFMNDGLIIDSLDEYFDVFSYFITEAQTNSNLKFIINSMRKLAQKNYDNFMMKGFEWEYSKVISDALSNMSLFLKELPKKILTTFSEASREQIKLLGEMKEDTKSKEAEQKPLLDFDRMMKNRKHPYRLNKFLSRYSTTFSDWNMELLYEYIDILGLQKEANKLLKTTNEKTTKEALFKYLYEPRSNPSYFVASNQDELERLHSLFSQVVNAVEKDINIFESDVQAEESKSKPNQNTIKELKDKIRRRKMLIDQLNSRIKTMEK